ncbi:MAG: hypothetical protein RKR03_21260 [Candidatus Competibacter sp.]|nr:hypothetical protein [Candidatus Competibacter sp.]
MTAVGPIEKKTQARVVALFRDTPNRNLQVQLPKPNEQTIIAAVFSDRDAEIAALEARRDKTRALKPGMMHRNC